MPTKPNISLESLVHGGFFKQAGEWIEHDLATNGHPQDAYRRLLYSIYFHQVARLNEARDILQIDGLGPIEDINAAFNYVKAALSQGRYSQAISMIAKLSAEAKPAPGAPINDLQNHLQSVQRALEAFTGNRNGPPPSTIGSHPTYWIAGCDKVQLSPSVLSDLPHRIDLRDAVFCPQSLTWYHTDSEQPVVELLQPNHDFSAFYGGACPEESTVLSSLRANAQTISGPVLYVPATLHFGHFLTQCAGFLHPISRANEFLSDEQPITCLLNGKLPDFFKHIIEMGSPRKISFLEIQSEPIHASQLIVSDSTWIEWHYCNRRHCDLFRNAATSLLLQNSLAQKAASANHHRIYLSRSRLQNGLRLSANENELEQHLETMGFTTVHPQDLRISELIYILNNAEIVVGPMGSAMHNLLFRTTNNNLKILNLAHFLPPYNFALIEGALGIRSNYYLRGCEEVRSAQGPNMLYFDVPSILSTVEGLLGSQH